MSRRLPWAATLLLATAAALSSAPMALADVIVVDNDDAAFTVLSGSWSTGTSAPGHWGFSYRFRSTTGSGGTFGEVEWRPNLPAADTYEVAVYYPQGTNRTDNAPFTIHHSGGSTPVLVNQQANGGTWHVLGEYSFAAGTSGAVTLSNDANPGVAIADAVRFRPLSTPPPTFIEQGANLLDGFAVNARSVSAADIDNDGDVDLMFQGSTGPQLFRNDVIGIGQPGFTEVPAMLPGGIVSTWSAAWADYDGDGDVDVFVGQANSGSNRGDLLRNDGPAGFVNVSAATGLDDPGFHQNVAWCDIDNDQDLDLLIAMEGPEKHEIYLQGPAQTFTAVGAAVGFQAPEGVKAYGMAIADTDGDGDLDVYISTCRSGGNFRNNFFRNDLIGRGGLGFVDIADSNGTQFMDNSYGAEFHDFDDDGDPDLFMVGADGQLSKIWRNDGNNLFTDVDTLTGHPLLSNVGGDLNGGRAIDYDNDGDLDLFFHDHKQLNGQDYARLLYRNDGAWEFTDVTDAAGLSSTNEGAYDSTWADVDLDGDLDLIAATDGGSPERLFVSSVSGNGNHWLYIRLHGPSGNTTGIGAELYATIHFGTPQQRTLRRDANTNAGTFNQSDLPVHFGLGSAATVDRLEVVWPHGPAQEFCELATDRYLDLQVADPGDWDGDGTIDGGDLEAFVDCMGGPDTAVAPASPACAETCIRAFDFNLDDRVDLRDFNAFQQSYTGP